MAIVNRNSTAITDMVAVPRVAVNPAKGAAGTLEETAGYVANAADDTAASIHRFCRVPSNARISEVTLSTADATTAGAMDLGLYNTGDSGAVVDADLFASAFALTAGPYDHKALTFESGEYTYAEAMKPLWEVLGLSADPNLEYDVASTITTTYNGAGVGQTVHVRYVR